jgi:hypothetical protein
MQPENNTENTAERRVEEIVVRFIFGKLLKIIEED